MCGISASFDIRILKDLIEVNDIRGNFSFSLTIIDPINNSIVAQHTSFYDDRKEILKYYKNRPDDALLYYISHCQAPTSDTGLVKNFNRIHPASFRKSYLYHNGIIKDSSINFMQNKVVNDRADTWDTSLLLKSIETHGYSVLNSINGSFACLLIEPEQISVFRNLSSIIYYDKDLNISSINFNGEMREFEPNTVFKLNLNTKALVKQYSFNSLDNNYAFV